MKQTILTVINSNSGIKEVQLAMRVMEYIQPSSFSDVEFQHYLKKLCENNEIVKVNYSLKAMPHTIKSIYFPAGTVIIMNSLRD